MQEASLRARQAFHANCTGASLHPENRGRAEFSTERRKRPAGSIQHSHSTLTVDQDHLVLGVVSRNRYFQDFLGLSQKRAHKTTYRALLAFFQKKSRLGWLRWHFVILKTAAVLHRIAIGTLAVITAVYAFQKPFREYPGLEYTKFTLPPDFQEKTEWVFARLMYPPVGTYYGGVEFLGSWKEGASNWTMDYPRSDRHIVQAIRRLTRVHTRSVEEPIDLDDGDVYDWPWLYGVEVGHWSLTDSQARTMREWLLRGGFFMCDDFHGSIEWDVFAASMHKVFPDRPIVDIADNDPIFHTIYDLERRYQVPGMPALEVGHTYEKGETGKTPHWRAIYDDNGRIMVAMCHNMDLGDSWEHADNPEYPAKYSDLGIRIGINYLIYSMSH